VIKTDRELFLFMIHSRPPAIGLVPVRVCGQRLIAILFYDGIQVSYPQKIISE
jgi:hypothetical protein